MNWSWKRKPTWSKDLITYNSHPWIMFSFNCLVITWKGGGSFEIGRPSLWKWKNFGCRWKKVVGVLKFRKFYGRHMCIIPYYLVNLNCGVLLLCFFSGFNTVLPWHFENALKLYWNTRLQFSSQVVTLAYFLSHWTKLIAPNCRKLRLGEVNTLPNKSEIPENLKKQLQDFESSSTNVHSVGEGWLKVSLQVVLRTVLNVKWSLKEKRSKTQI